MNPTPSALQALQQRLRGVASGFHGLAIALTGEAGIGKTYTLKSALGKLGSLHVLHKASESPQALLERLPKPQNNLPQIARETFSQLQKGEIIEPKRFAEALCLHLANHKPLVLCLEDIHESSSQQRECWLYVAKYAKRTRGLGIVATSREALPEVYESLRLTHLDGLAIYSMLQNSTPLVLPDTCLKWIAQHTGGNPLFALEYLRFLQHQKHLWSDGKSWHWKAPKNHALPSSVQQIIAQRLESLAEPALEQVLLRLALLPPEVAWRGHNKKELQERLEQHGIWRDGEFVHPLYPQVLRQHIWVEARTALARAELHKNHVPQVQVQLVKAAAFDSNQAKKVWLDLADTAENTKDQSTLATALQAAIALMPASESPALCLRAAIVLKNRDMPAALRLLELAKQQQPNNPEVSFALVSALSAAGRFTEAEQLLFRLEPSVLHSPIGLAHQIQLKVKQNALQEAVLLWQEHQVRLTDSPTRVERAVVSALVLLRRFDDAFAIIDELAPSSAPLERFGLLLVKANALRQLGQSQEALLIYAQLEALVAAPDYPVRQTDQELIWNNRALVYQSLGRTDEAIADLERSIAALEEIGDHYRLAVRQSNLAGTLITYGQFERAEDLLLEARATLEMLVPSRFLVGTEQNLCLLYLDWMPPLGGTLALHHARNAWRYAQQVSSQADLMQQLIYIAWAEAIYGDATLAEQLNTQQLDLANQTGSSIYQLYGRWVRLFVLEGLGKQPQALAEYPAFLEECYTQNQGASFVRIALEYDRMRGDATSAKARIESLKDTGDDSRLVLHLAQRYFPDIFGSQNIKPNAAQKQLEVLGEIRLGGEVIAEKYSKIKTLLLVLLEAKLMNQPADAYFLIDQLYPSIPEQQARASLRQLIKRTRTLFGEDIIETRSTTYHLGVRSDAEVFLETHDTNLWRGPTVLRGGSADILSYALQNSLEKLQNPTEVARVVVFTT